MSHTSCAPFSFVSKLNRRCLLLRETTINKFELSPSFFSLFLARLKPKHSSIARCLYGKQRQGRTAVSSRANSQLNGAVGRTEIKVKPTCRIAHAHSPALSEAVSHYYFNCYTIRVYRKQKYTFTLFLADKKTCFTFRIIFKSSLSSIWPEMLCKDIHLCELSCLKRHKRSLTHTPKPDLAFSTPIACL